MNPDPDLTRHVQPSTTGQPAEFFHRAEPNTCRVCSLELPAGHGRHPGCDARWLQTPTPATTQRGASNE